MSCCCWRKHELIVSYKGLKKEKSGGINNYYQVLQWIYKEFPDLRCQELSLYMDQIKLIPSNYLPIFKTYKSIEITVSLVKSTIKTNLGVFKLRLPQSDLLCTGFLVSPTYCIIPADLVQDHLNNDKRPLLLFENDEEVELNPTSQGIELGHNLLAFELKTPVINFKPISLENSCKLTQSSLATESDLEFSFVLMFTREKPVLTKTNLKTLGFNIDSYSIEKELPIGASGCPILSQENDLIAIINSFGEIVFVSSFYNLLRDNIELPHSVDQSIIKDHPGFMQTACFFDSCRSEGQFYSTDEALNKVFKTPEMILGSTAVVSNHGIIIVGLSPDQNPKTWLFDGKNTIELPPTKKKHLYHSCLALDDEIYVISGSTPSVEVYNFNDSTWKLIEPLEKRRAMASAAYYNNNIYLIGGRREKKFIRSILKYADNSWVKINLKLDIGVSMLGCIVRHKDFLIFGGETTGKKNLQSWSVNVRKKEIHEEKYSVENNFGRFSQLYLEDEVLLYANDGTLYKYDMDSYELFTVSLDKEDIN
ncbi:hypothetical protein SteCoe_12208 [Stentor coeruleus]|uniref:Uncharacterized protein n=1 Tax=Stentor coeruleus TaxID=5963 RepID=A0A1R2CBC5_9CILI|nr:hypothetical protein SteCoe_12208 [Stentor coeruleus]